MISERVRRRTRGLLAEVGRIVARTGVTPGMLTWLGFLMSGGTAWVLAQGEFLFGGVLVIGAGLFDALDGSVARATGRMTKFGAFLDSTLDRFSEAVVYLGLLVFYARQTGTRQEVLLIYVIIVGSLMVSYSRARAEGLGLECKVGLFTRLERVVVLALGLLLNQVRVTLWIVAAGSLLTAGQRMWHVWRLAGTMDAR